jgi:DNA ligase (NAD+)
LSVVITGTLEKFTREEAQELLKAKGYKISSGVTKKTSLVVVGANPGSKYSKAKELGIKIIDETELQNLL